MADIIVSRATRPVDGLTFTITGDVTVSVTYDFEAEIITRKLLPAGIDQQLFSGPVNHTTVPEEQPASLPPDAVSSTSPLYTIEKRTVHISGSFRFNNPSSSVIVAKVYADTSSIEVNQKNIVVYDDNMFLGYESSAAPNGIQQLPGAISLH